MYDEDGDGFISLQEMTRYLTTVFKMLYESSPAARDAMGVSPGTLADVTAQQCFADAGTGAQGLLSFDEFQLWYSKSGQGEEDSAAAKLESAPSSKPGPSFTLAEMSALTGLGAHHVDDVFQLLAHCADAEGLLSPVAFASCFRALLGEHSSNNLEAWAAVESLFSVVAEGGIASFDRTASALSVLCGGTQEEKVTAAFNLFDLAASGFIARDEMLTYMTAVFSVLFETSADVKVGL